MMNQIKRWGIAPKRNVILENDADTKASRYPLKAYTVHRKFFVRDAARAYKQARKVPTDYVIVDLTSGYAVR